MCIIPLNVRSFVLGKLCRITCDKKNITLVTHNRPHSFERPIDAGDNLKCTSDAMRLRCDEKQKPNYQKLILPQ